MKNAKQITLSGITFSIEEDAYQILKTYITDITHYFQDTDKELSDEIIKDIESGIAEKMLTCDKSVNKAITVQDVEHVIEELGSIEDLRTADESEGSTYKDASKKSSNKKRLYRDGDDGLVAGVASGLAKYFSVDVVIVRILFLISLLFSSIGFWVYIVLWMAVPKAKTQSEKMAMYGDSVNLESVKSYVKDRLNDIPEDSKERTKSFLGKYLFKRGRKNGEEISTNGLYTLQALFVFARKFIGFLTMFITGLVMIILTMVLMAIFSGGFVVDMDVATQQLFADIFSKNVLLLLAMSLYTLIIVPLLFIFMIGKWLVFLKTKINATLAISMGVVWMMALSYIIVSLVFFIPRIGTYIKTSLQSSPSSHLYLRISDSDDGELFFDAQADTQNGIFMNFAGENIFNKDITLGDDNGDPIPFITNENKDLIGGDAVATPVVKGQKEFTLIGDKNILSPSSLIVALNDTITLRYRSHEGVSKILIKDFKVQTKFSSGNDRVIVFKADKVGDFPILLQQKGADPKIMGNITVK